MAKKRSAKPKSKPRKANGSKSDAAVTTSTNGGKETANDSSRASTKTSTTTNSTNQYRNAAGIVLMSIIVVFGAIIVALVQSIKTHTLAGAVRKVNATTFAYTPGVLLPYQQFFGNLLVSIDEDVNTTHLKEQWNKLRSSIEAASNSTNAAAIGRRMVEQHNLKAKHPVFLVPGFVTSGLELWQGHPCAEAYFRRKIWGSLETLRSFAQDTECWRKHLSLDRVTGQDPPGIRLRPSQGFEAADFWTSAFWVWDRVIRNLAAVGYDGSNMDMVSYDWRLSYPALEERDGHFSKFKSKIESFVRHSGEKAVLVGHSMGGPKTFFFLVWVGRPKEEGGGGGGPDWVDKHIHAFVNLAGPMLGLPKAASALLSGDMKETNLLSPIGNLIESFFGRKRRHELFSSWGALWGMAPKGGDAVWGVTGDIDCGHGRVPRGDQCVNENEAGDPLDVPFLTFTDTIPPLYENPTHTKYAAKSTWSYSDVVEYLKEWKQGEHGPESLKDTSAWNDPTQHGLPNAPSLNVYCLYGVGLQTERMFYYRRQQYVEGDVPFLMNDTVKDDTTQSINYGVRTANGDGSVPLISLGYMCAQGWKGDAKLNPGQSRIVPKEYAHRGSFQVDDPLRQGPESSEHCDILGNHEVLEDLIKIATGDAVEPRIVSNIEQIATEIHDRISKS